MRKFSDIIGQKAIIEHLYNALRTGSVSHAYMISGDAGSGRKTIASIFAAALQCEDLELEEIEMSGPPAAGRGTKRKGSSEQAAASPNSSEKAAAHPNASEPSTVYPNSPERAAARSNSSEPAAMRPRTRLLEPCGKCLSCLQAQSGNQPDIITVTHEKPNSISVKEIRDMRADLSIKPYSNARKIYIIPDAEKLTTQAQNALLKTLEEPPEYAVIILIADGISAFLPTILSRCVVLQTRAVEEAQIAEFLQREKNLPQDQAQILARFAGGNPGQALLLTQDQEFLELRDRTVDFLAHLQRADAMQVSEFASGIEPGRREEVLSFVMMWFRDVLLYFSTQNSENLIFQEDIQYIIEAAGMLGYEQLGMILDEIDLASRRLKSNVSADSVFEVMFLKIRQQYRRRI